MIITITCSDGQVQTDERLLLQCKTYKNFKEDTKSLIFPIPFSTENIELFLDFVVNDTSIACIDIIRIANYLELDDSNLCSDQLKNIFKYDRIYKQYVVLDSTYVNNFLSVIKFYDDYYTKKEIFYIEVNGMKLFVSEIID